MPSSVSPRPLLLLGHAPFDDSASRRYAAQLRTLQLLQALRAADLEVDVLGGRIPGTSAPAQEKLRQEAPALGSTVTSVPLAWLERPGVLRRQLQQRDYAAIVGAGSFASACACRISTRLPIWADLHGEPLAEGQAKAATYGDDSYIAAFSWRTWACLRRADAFSTVSERQRFATLGQLGLAGRLNQATFDAKLVHVIGSVPEPLPPAAGPSLRGDILPLDAVAVLWLGGWNTWADPGTCFDALEQAMAARPELHFVATGGSIPGQDDRTFRAFQARVETSPHRQRFHLLGWLEQPRVHQVLLDCDIALVIDVACAETELGCRTRAATALAAGLPVLATRGVEFLELAAAADAAVLIDSDPDRRTQLLTAALQRLASDAHERSRRADAALTFAAGRTAETTAAALAAWAREPRRAQDAAAVDHGHLLSPAQLLRRGPEPAGRRLLRAVRHEGPRSVLRRLRDRVRGSARSADA